MRKLSIAEAAQRPRQSLSHIQKCKEAEDTLAVTHSERSSDRRDGGGSRVFGRHSGARGMKGRSALEDVALESGSPAGAQGWMLREEA